MRKKIHIALVGGQTMPIFLGIKETTPDEIVLVHSSTSQKEAKRIQTFFPDNCRLKLFDPVDNEAILVSAKTLFQDYAESKITVNLSSGTKPWALVLALQAQRMDNVSLLYIDQNGMCYDYTHNKKWAAQGLDMITLMQFNGQQAESHLALKDYTDEDLDTMREVKIFMKYNYGEFNWLTIPDKSWKKVLSDEVKGSHKTINGSYIDWDKTANSISLSMRVRWGYKEKKFESPHVFQIVFNSGWFEYEVAQLVGKWQYAKEVWMNVVYPYNNKLPKNEIDIIVNTGNKLLMIECKTKIFDNTDIDKFHTAVKNYGGMGCKALFITKAQMTPEAKEKCADSSIMSFSLQDYQNRNTAQKYLFQLLNKELFNINTK